MTGIAPCPTCGGTVHAVILVRALGNLTEPCRHRVNVTITTDHVQLDPIENGSD